MNDILHFKPKNNTKTWRMNKKQIRSPTFILGKKSKDCMDEAASVSTNNIQTICAKAMPCFSIYYCAFWDILASWDIAEAKTIAFVPENCFLQLLLFALFYLCPLEVEINFILTTKALQRQKESWTNFRIVKFLTRAREAGLRSAFSGLGLRQKTHQKLSHKVVNS